MSDDYQRKQDALHAQFRDAVDRCDLPAAVKMCEKDWRVELKGVGYVVKTQSLSFAVNFMDRLKHESYQVFVALYRTGSRRVIEAVLKEVEMPRNCVFLTATTCTVMRTPDLFLELLDRIEEDSHESAIRRRLQSSAL